MKKNIHYSIVIILFTSSYLISQQQEWTTFTSATGLVHNKVESICESSDGAIWVGTAQGVSRYYEGNWIKYTATNTDSGLLDDYLEAICESSDGALWFGSNTMTGNGGVSRYFQGKWTKFTVDSGLAYNDVIAICESNDGALWFGTPKGGVSRLFHGEWTTFNSDSEIASNSVTEILQASDGALWFATSYGICRYYQDNWTIYNTNNSGLLDNSVKAICEGKDGAIWFGIFGATRGGACRYYNGKWISYNSDNSGLVYNSVLSVCESSDGALWFGTWGSGVSCFYHGSWTTYTTGDGLGNDEVNAILESSDGAIWFGTDYGGLSRYYQNSWTIFNPKNSGLASQIVYAICETNDSTLWFGTSSGGVNRYHQGDWSKLTTDNGLASNYVHAIQETSDGALWFGYGNIFEWEGKGVSRFYQGNWENFTTADGLVDNNVFEIFESSDGALWFGTNGATGTGGVSRYYQSNWTTFNTDSGLVGNDVGAICESFDGAMWFGTSEEGFSWERYGGGVSRYYQGKWTTFTTDNGLVNNSVYAIVESVDGALWFGTNKGISRYYQGNWTTFTMADGLADSTVLEIIESSDGALWFGTSNGGVSRYYKGEWTTFTTADGLASVNVGAILESSYGAFWFGNSSGANLGDFGGGVSRLKPDNLPPLTFISEGPENLVRTSTPMFIINGRDNFTEKEELLYSYFVVKKVKDVQINPDSSSWFPFSLNRVIQTEPLQNGEYLFFVRAKDEWGNIDPTPATRTFIVDITPPIVIINFPKQEEHIKENVPIIGFAFDNSPIKDFKYYELAYDNFTSLINSPNWKNFYQDTTEVEDDTLGIFNTSVLNDGQYQIRLWAIDTLNHTSEYKVQVTVDNTAPMLKITSPKSEEAVRKNVTIQASINDHHLEKYTIEFKMIHIDQWQILHQDTINYAIENQPIYTWENASDSGNVLLRLTAWDQAGNATSDTVEFIWDNLESRLPTANILFPFQNAYVHDFIQITGFATDKNFTRYSLFLKGEAVDTLLIESPNKKENDILFTLNTRTLPDGKYQLCLIVLNESQYQKIDCIEFTIDNTRPIAQLRAPVSDTLSCYQFIEGEAADANLKSIALKYAKVGETDTSKFILIDTTFTDWNTIELNGYHNLYLIVEDLAGLTASDRRTYYIHNPVFDKRQGLRKKQHEFSLYIPPNGYQTSTICFEKKNCAEFSFNPELVNPTELICDIQSSVDQSNFAKPATFSIDYSSINLSNYDENKLKVFHWKNNTWLLVGGTVNPKTKIITTPIKEIGTYGVLENLQSIAVADGEFALDCQPRMISPQGGGYSPETNISFSLNKDSDVTIKIFNLAGRLVDTLCENKYMSVGLNSAAWNGKDSAGKFCVSGLYLVMIQTGGKNESKTVMVLNKY